VPESLRQYEAPRLGRVLLKIRQRPEFTGWFHVEQTGSRNVTWYCRPVELDL
jgi:hypothetical protein